jgi:ankyrin repeat protein
MFRNSYQTVTQTVTRNNDNTLNNSNAIICAVVTGNIIELRNLVNTVNVNRIIDNVNEYTALHYAVGLPNQQVIKYLIECGGDIDIKNKNNEDCLTLSLASNRKFIVNLLLEKNDKEIDIYLNKIDDLNYKNKNLEKTVKELKETNNYLNKSNDEYIEKINNIKLENSELKRKLDDSNEAFKNILKKQKK